MAGKGLTLARPAYYLLRFAELAGSVNLLLADGADVVGAVGAILSLGRKIKVIGWRLGLFSSGLFGGNFRSRRGISDHIWGWLS
jgi:hypothetical protein